MPPATTPVACVPDLLRARATVSPDDIALLVDGTDGLTFAGWEERSNAVGRGLAARGVRRGDRVALWFDNSRLTAYAVAYVAIHKAGAVAVPLSTRFAPAELARVLAHCRPAALLCDPGLVPDTLALTPWSPGEVADGQAGDAFQVALGPGEPAEILYTSGTTGTPKGVACSHESIVAFDLPSDPEAETGHRSILHAFPIGTNAAQELLRVPLRRERLTVVVMSAFDAERLCQVVAQHGVRRLQLVPATAQVLVASGAPERHDVSSVERVTLSSAPTPPALVGRLRAAFPNASVWVAYALTESGGARTLVRCDDGWRGSVGRPVGRTELRVVDDSGNEVAPGTTGEVWLRSRRSPAREYYGDPEATASTWVDGWLRTGDLGYLGDDGELYLVDRRKDLIISGGLNVSSLEVESVLYEHPAVMEAAVFGVDHQVLGQDVAAAVVSRAPVGERELQAFVRARLGEGKVPHRVIVVDRLPRNDSGKVLKRVLRERLSEAPSPAGVAPATDTERAVAAVWTEILGVARVDADADFFALGGHSLAAAQVAARLEEQFDVELGVTAVFQWPTVAELAAAVDALRSRD